MKSYRTSLVLFLSAVLSGFGVAEADEQEYNPLDKATARKVEMLDLKVLDREREREIPIRVYLPKSSTPQPLILFSHGLGGSPQAYTYLGSHWSARDYLAVFLQHPGSDVSVWKDSPPNKRMRALKEAADKKNFMLRVKDVPAVIDQLERWNREEDHQLHNRINLEKIGMAGHSFGAMTTQALSGQEFGFGWRLFTDDRIDAALAMSPSAPRRGSPESAFGDVDIPWMLMTGTQDVAPIGEMDVKARLSVFSALKAGGKYLLVLKDARHSAFSDKPLPWERGQRGPNHHKAIKALSTAYWDTWLNENAAAKEWLHGNGPSDILEAGDTWKKKL